MSENNKARNKPAVSLKRIFSYLFISFDKLLSVLRLQRFYSDRDCFKKIFYRSESNVLLGANSRYFWIVFSLFFLTILAIGFANDSLRYLELQMSDPFVKHVTANVDHGFQDFDRLDSYQQIKNDTIYLSAMGVHSISEFTRIIENFDNHGPPFRGRSVLPHDPLVESILGYPDNQSIGHGFDVEPQFLIRDTTNYGVILTYNVLEQLGRDTLGSPFISLRRGSMLFPVPILAVVNQLPDNVDFIVSPFYVDYVRSHERFFFGKDRPSNKLYVMLDISGQVQNSIGELLDELVDAWRRSQIQVDLEHSPFAYEIRPYSVAYRPTMLVQFNLRDTLLLPYAQDQLFEEIMVLEPMQRLIKKYSLEGSPPLLFYNPAGNRRLIPDGEIRSRHNVAINFDHLKHVRDFAGDFQEKTTIALEMGKIRSLENYFFVTVLTLVVSFALIVFSFLSIGFFVGHMIENHLNKIKMNIGTYKAFGIQIRNIYKNMVFVFILVSQLAALMVCWLVAEFGFFRKAISLINPEIGSDFKFFHVFDAISITILVLMLLISYFYSTRIINALFDLSPGDLVYNRDVKK